MSSHAARAETEVARQARAESMRMAVELRCTFDALIPYFVYRTVLEQQVEETLETVNAAQHVVHASRQRYNRAMEALEALSLELQATAAERNMLQDEGAGLQQ